MQTATSKNASPRHIPQPDKGANGYKLGDPVTYQGLPTKIISGPRNSCGILVVTLAFVGWPVAVDDADMKVQRQYREPEEFELQEFRIRNEARKNK